MNIIGKYNSSVFLEEGVSLWHLIAPNYPIPRGTLVMQKKMRKIPEGIKLGAFIWTIVYAPVKCPDVISCVAQGLPTANIILNPKRNGKIFWRK